jgi:hypothetical protein
MTRNQPIRSRARLQSAQRKLASRLLVDAWSGTRTPMTVEQEIEALRARIDMERRDRDAWRVCGPEEKFLEACFLVEALTMQLDRCVKHLTDGQPAS